MSRFTNDAEFRKALDALELPRQRQVGALLTQGLLSHTADERVNRALEVAKDAAGSADARQAALKSAKAAALDAHARCGADGDWTEQADYFVARAAVACLSEPVRSHGKGVGWQAAVSCRMAVACVDAEQDSGQSESEIERQYQVLAAYLGT
jgi:hypothetical protein